MLSTPSVRLLSRISAEYGSSFIRAGWAGDGAMRVSGIRAQRDHELSLYRGGMRSAMPRFLTVNGFSARPPVPRGSQDVNFDPDASAGPEFGGEPASYGLKETSDGVATTRYGVASTIRKTSSDQGPCLYFGPQGQRCDRRAVADGFCRRHLSAQLGETAQPGVARSGSKPFARVIAVGIAIFAALWPVIAELLREIFRWINAH